MSNSEPTSSQPPPNPLLTAYENFVSSTPFVSRSLFFLQGVTYLLSWFLPLDYALANFPQLTVYQFEVYRIFTSPLANSSLFDLALAYMVVVPVTKRLEWSLGSVKLGYLCGILALWSNVAFLALSFILYLVSASDAWLIQSTGSIWIVAFGLLAVEALQAEHSHAEKQRRVCFLSVPTRYFPLAFCLLFSILSLNFNLGLLISMALGYAVGFGQNIDTNPLATPTLTDSMLLSVSRVQQLEDATLLSQLASRVGWVSSQAASGMAAWNMDPPGHSGGDAVASSSGLPMFQMPDRRAVSGASSNEASGGGGRTLGGASRRAVDPRTARLQALDGKKDPEGA